MQTDRFEQIVTEQTERCMDILTNKAKEYATEDRLHNFKIAAIMQDITPSQALAGMLAKHTVSIYDMCNSGDGFPIEVWNEKITDHMNYLYLLRALIDPSQDI